MHWADEIAADLIRQNPEKESFTCASGISPSGIVHMGNFREVVTSYFVACALRSAGKKVRFLYSWDNYDRLRKIPKNVDESFVKNIGLPLDVAPNPTGGAGSYARYFQAPFENSMKEFGIEVEFINQSEMYQSGVYKDGIKKAIKNRKEIYDILMSFKSQEAKDDERETFVPLNIYCSVCSKDSTKIKSVSDDSRFITYTCACGNEHKLDLDKDFNAKLPWKVDWPMRWVREGVDFEPGGRDHSSEGGSYQVASVIVDKVFGGKPPYYRGYEFIGIKGATTKMSSSTGLNMMPEEMLKIYSPEVILWMFTRFLPEKGFDFALDDEVLRQYHEFDRMYKSVEDGTADDTVKRIMELALAGKKDFCPVSAAHIASFAPIVNFDLDMLVTMLNKLGENVTKEQVAERFEKIKYWLINYCPDQIVKLLEKKNTAFFATMTAEEKAWVSRLVECLKTKDYSLEDMQALLYDIPKINNEPDKARQKRFFEVTYNLLLGKDKGPRLYLFLTAVEKDKLLALLDL